MTRRIRLRSLYGLTCCIPSSVLLGLEHVLTINCAEAALFTVANLYYNQPVLNQIAEEFNVSFEESSSVATLMQSGYAAGLLFLCPLGDWFKPRPFILGLVGLTATFVSPYQG